jgi:hypothetical protein
MERVISAQGAKGLEALLAEFLRINQTGEALDPNEGLLPIFLKMPAYCRWSGQGETRAREDIKAGRLETVRDRRNVLITYRSALKRAREIAAETLEPPDRRAAIKRALDEAEANFQLAE